MQLNPEERFAPQIYPLLGKEFENIVAASYYYLGYFINRNLTVKIAKQTAAEIDVLASLITPLNETRIAIECKGQTPSFNDLRKFSTIRTIIGSDNIDLSLAAYGANDIRSEHLAFSSKLSIKLFKKKDVSKIVLPILWADGQLVKERIFWINRYLSVFTAKDYLFNTVYESIQDQCIKKEISKYRRYLFSDLWSISNPVDQINNSFEKAQNEFNNFTEKIANRLGTNANSQVSNPTDEIVQLAMLLELEHRVLNLVGITRCSILARTQHGRDIITERTPTIRNILNALCDYNMSIMKFCPFMFRWIYLWGGIIIKSNNLEEKEYQLIANESGISVVNAKQFIQVIKEIYSSGNSLFYESNSKLFFKYIPAVFRTIGKIHRKSIAHEVYDGINLFFEDNANENIANICLSSIGGIEGLKFK